MSAYVDDVSGTLLRTWQCWLSLERTLGDWEEPEGQVGIIPHNCVFISGFDGFKNISCASCICTWTCKTEASLFYYRPSNNNAGLPLQKLWG